MDEQDSTNIGLVSCVRFVRRNVAKAVPEKVNHLLTTIHVFITNSFTIICLLTVVLLSYYLAFNFIPSKFEVIKLRIN